MAQHSPASKLRVVFIDHVARLSGGELALLHLLPALSSEIDMHVILGEDGPLVTRLRDAGISAEVMPLPARLRDVRKEKVRLPGLGPSALLPIPAYVRRLSRRLAALDADLVHTNSLKAALYGGTAARLARVPAVWHVRDRIAVDYLPRGGVALVRAASRVLPSFVVANSRATLATLPENARSRVIYNPVVAPDSVEQLGRLRASRSTEIAVGVVGRLASWKGQNVFLDAFAAGFRGTAVRGRIIGSAMFGEHAYEGALREQVERLGISSQIEFRGFREDVWEELGELDIFVHCSVTPEPFGQVVLEAMAAGVPVIAAGAGGPAELITDGVDGLLTTPGDVGELAAALRRLHDDPPLRNELARAAKERSLEFTPERTAARLLAVYRQIARRD
jgi:glycosyltransferase involved in cell wall biosynthesis